MHPRPVRHQPQLDSGPGPYFSALAAAYEQAVRQRAEQRFDLAIGNRHLRVSFASSELASALIPPLERLRVEPQASPSIRIRVWDTASTGVRVPAFAWAPADIGPGGTIAGYDDGRFRTLYRDDEDGFHALSMFDSRRQTAYLWFADHERIHWYERAEPLRAAIHWSLTSSHRYLAHASAVGDERGAVVLTGRGGAGKTTTTLAAIEAGLRFVGDNYVLIELEERPEVLGLYGTAKLWPQTLEQLPHLQRYVRTFEIGPEEKLVVDLMRYRPEQFAPRLPISAVVVPVLADHCRTALRRCSRVDALLALAPSTLLQLPRADGGLSGMSELVQRVPTYKLELGHDVMSGPAAISSLLDEVSGGA